MPKFKEPQEKVIDNPHDEASAPRGLDDIADDVGTVYFIQKDAEAEYKDLRKEFFDAATEQTKKGQLAQKTVAIPSSVSEENARAFLERYHTGWVVQDVKEVGGSLRAILKQDPSLVKYEHVVEAADSLDDQTVAYVVTKSVVSGSMVLDDERLLDEDPDLWYEVTEWPNQVAMFTLLRQHGTEGLEIEEVLEYWYSQQGIQRQLKKLSDIPDDVQKRLAPYLYETPKTLKLLVKRATPKQIAEL